MLISFSRTSRNMVANWWWTVDKALLVAVFILIGCGVLLSLSASPVVAKTIGKPLYHFVFKHAVFLCGAVVGLLFLSMLNLRQVRRVAILGYVTAVFLMILTLFFGIEIKGSRRWIDFGIQLQPSEFIKPTFVICTAWLFEMQRQYRNFSGLLICSVLGGLTCLLLLLQPDYGMTFVVGAVWFVQLFLSGMPLKKVVLGGSILSILMAGAYVFLPHVQVRMKQLLDGVFGDSPADQVKYSLNAFKNGGLFGVGVGEGVIKWKIPDAHADFIFPVAGEEYGMIFCLFIVLVYAFVVIRSMLISLRDNNMFIVLSVCGLAISFGLQAFINMAATLQIGPAKGMALPLISYGGSALLGAAITIGILLSLTRKNIHAENKDYV